MPSPDELPPGFREGVLDFLDALRVEAGLARSTVEAYRRDLALFLRWAAERGAHGWSDLTADLVVDHLSARRAAGRAEATVARGLSALRMALRHQVAEGRLARDPMARIPAPRLRRALPSVLDVEEVERLLAAPTAAAAAPDADPGHAWRGLRDRALLEVLYASGARVSEAIGLRTDELEPSLGVVRLRGKGGKHRVVPLGGRAREALDAWLERGRPTRPGASRRAEVFLSRTGLPLDRTAAWRRVQAAAREAGLSVRVSPHTLRHSFASHLIEGGADLRAVQELLGHASIRTTEVYTHLDGEHVRSLHRLYHPRA